MKLIRVMVEMDLAVEDSSALRAAAAQTMYEIERDAERRGVTLTANGESPIELTQTTDASALAYLVQLELPYEKELPGCRLGDARVRAFEIVSDAQEAAVNGNRRAE